MRNYSLLFSTSLCLLSTALLISYQLGDSTLMKAGSSVLAYGSDGCGSAKGLARIVCLAEAFNATLSADQKATIQRTYSKADATRWSNFPEMAQRPRRVGIKLGTLTDTQLKAAKALLAAAMNRDIPNEGFNELEGNLAADEYLGKLIGKTDFFTAGNYYMAFLGTPSTTGLWELQFGGHHFAFANTYKEGKLTGVTPSFRGVEPIAPVTVNGHTYQSMEGERAAFASLLGSLTGSQQSAARLSGSFSDILLGPDRDGQFPATKQGLKASELTTDQKKLVLEAINRYVNDLDPATVADVLASYTKDLDNTFIAFSGSGTMSQPGDYVRIDGPRVWIEYSGQASRDIPGTVHPHSVWRDHTSDYGGN